MAAEAIGLIIISTFLHAGWNLLARRQRSEMEFFARMVILTIVVGFLPTLVSELAVRSLPGKAWLCLAGSGLCSGIYFYCLARAYESSEFTIVYPMARALPVLLVGLGDVVRGRFLTPLGWLGLLLVVLGCLLSPLHSFREFNIRSYFHRSILWMFLAALGTTGYSLLDKVASEVVSSGPGTAARYGYVFFFFSGLVFLSLRRITNRHQSNNNRLGWKAPALGAICNCGAYWLILWVYQLTMRASYVVAFRQFSIIIGVVLAFAIYKERGMAVRITGSVLITAGLILVGIYGG